MVLVQLALLSSHFAVLHAILFTHITLTEHAYKADENSFSAYYCDFILCNLFLFVTFLPEFVSILAVDSVFRSYSHSKLL